MPDKGQDSGQIQLTAILKGLICSFIILIITSIILGFLFSMINVLSEDLINRILLAINYAAIFIGGIYTAREASCKGWLNGGLMGFCYMFIIMILGVQLVGIGLNLEVLLRIMSGFLAGAVGGVIGVNLK
ncbi:hypothetical protein BBF96_03030 [Anoxybacter fermentans]|uniref:TIGR04086 family membrane protein n=1 Tax=Anoxybacter fermentans TaxID=1323375 RepID=A0A3Q9HP18_9FIRM|nr:TIGR04086 family membrane protein [Anoxybacter fermentans]AZR72446.1 hypothetical protein BBF96_03030 [Anoxybacter fermentans]